MNKILILGASGFLGKSLVGFFLANNFRVGALSRTFDQKNDKLDAYAVNILDYESLEPIIAQYDIIINCTGQITDPIHNCIILNTKGVQNIIDAVKKNKNYLIHLSTVSVYGSSSGVSEKSTINPESVYGSIKYFAEYQISHHLTNYVILRMSNLYGKGQSKGALGYILRTFRNNQIDLFFNNNGSLKRYYLHIDDLTSIINIVLEKKLKGVFNIAGNEYLTIKQLISLCERVLEYSFNVRYASIDPLENIEYIDKSKFKKQINYLLQNNIEMYLKEIN